MEDDEAGAVDWNVCRSLSPLHPTHRSLSVSVCVSVCVLLGGQVPGVCDHVWEL